MVFGPKGTPREPQETQNPPKRNPKRIKTTNKKIKKLAQKINILWTIVWDQKCSQYIPRKTIFKKKLRKTIFYKTNFTQDKNIKNTDLHPNLDQHFCTKPKADLHETQNNPNRVIISLKKTNTCLQKNWKNTMVFNAFGSRDLPRDPQETQETPKEAPKDLQWTKKNNQKKQKNASLVKNALAWR